MRKSGVLLPISALPSRFGIGCFSKEAYHFVDMLRQAGQSYWQILPLGPTGFGDSPYQSFSTFAGNPYYIDLEVLIRDGLLTEEECSICETIDLHDVCMRDAIAAQDAAASNGMAQDCAAANEMAQDNTAASEMAQDPTAASAMTQNPAAANGMAQDSAAANGMVQTSADYTDPVSNSPYSQVGSTSIARPDRIDYEHLYHTRLPLLHKAFERYDCAADPEFGEFVRNQGYWLEDYALYQAIKDERQGQSWIKWEKELRESQPGALQECREKLGEKLQFIRFVQYLFFKQWGWLKNYANENGVRIIGDIPIYVAFDSADTWANPMLFQFDEENVPIAVAGCPPDYFSPTGQLWGNPLYSWEYHKETDYVWWLQRFTHCFNMYDVVRVDHFRGFDEYYSIPYGDATAEFGHWEKGPGIGFFQSVGEKLGDMPIIAEDLGFLTDGVRQLLYDTGYPGMKVLQFAFDGSEDSDYLPHKYEHNAVVYTGTHDNETTRGWYETLNEHDLEFTRRYLHNERSKPDEIVWDFIRLAQASVADLCIIPMQDYLDLGNEARINTPSVLGGNWQWRMLPDVFDTPLAEKIWQMTKLYGRL